MEEDDWKVLASQREYEFYETLGSRQYDEIEKNDLFQLKKKVGFATCGKPSEMPNSANCNTGYTKEELGYIKLICDKVIEKSDYDPIRFSCTILILYHKGVVCETPVFRILSNDGNIFIDAHARVYQTWDLFMQNNKLPDCEYCYPINGEYNSEGELLVGFAFSPASRLLNKATNCLDTIGTVAAVAAAGVVVAGSVVTVAPAAISAAGATALCTGVYNVTRSVRSLYDRKKHEQSIGLKDQESRSAWLAIGSSAIGVSQMAALRGAQKVAESGRSISKLGMFGLHALTASSLVFSGFGFVENLFICADKYSKGILTRKDVFDLSCELLFLFNAIASAKATTQLVNNMNTAVVEASSSQKKLTKTQKRNLRKRAAKRRARGLPTVVPEESNKFTQTGVSATLQLLLFEAVKAYAPRLQEILYTCQSIGHDVMCWRTNEISDIVLMSNLSKKLIRLYNDYKDDINETMNKIFKFFRSVTDDILQLIYAFYETASNEVKSNFCTKVVNVEDQMELLINEGERDVIDLNNSLETDYCSQSFDDDEVEHFDDEDENLIPEAQSLLKSCGDVINVTKWSCNDLQEFEEILEGVKHVVVSEFKANKDNYLKSLEAAKEGSGENLNIETYHKKLGIRGEVSQHIYREILKKVTTESFIYKVKTKLKDLKKEKNLSTVPVWDAMAEGMFHYYGPHGKGDLSQQELISVVGSVFKGEISFSEENYTWMEENDVVMISIKNQPNLQIVVYCGITEENTASGIIVVVK